MGLWEWIVVVLVAAVACFVVFIVAPLGLYWIVMRAVFGKDPLRMFRERNDDRDKRAREMMERARKRHHDEAKADWNPRGGNMEGGDL